MGHERADSTAGFGDDAGPVGEHVEQRLILPMVVPARPGRGHDRFVVRMEPQRSGLRFTRRVRQQCQLHTFNPL